MATYEQRVQRDYTRIATTYDGAWADVLAADARALTERLDLTGSRRVAELGCGPGRLLDHLQTRVPHALLVGADLTEAMLRRAPPAFSRVVADAQTLPFATGCFDAVLMPFVLFHISRLDDALGEVRRTLRPGGSFGAVTWSEHEPHPAFDVWVAVIDAYGAPPDPSPQMPAGEVTADPKALRATLETAGFCDVSMTLEPFRHTPTREQFVEHATVIGSNARRLSLLSEDVRVACLAEAVRRLCELDPDDFTESGRTLYAVARATDVSDSPRAMA